MKQQVKEQEELITEHEQIKSFYEWAEDRLSAHEVEGFLYWANQTHGVGAERPMKESEYLRYEEEFRS